MSDTYSDPVNVPKCQRQWMGEAAWFLKLPPIEKLVFLRTVHCCEWMEIETWLTSLPTIADDIGGSLLDASKALSSLETKGMIKVQEFKGLRSIGLAEGMDLHITPDFHGTREYFWSQRDERGDAA